MHLFPPVGSLFESGRIVDGILALMAVELTVLMALGKRGPARGRSLELAAGLGAGAALLLALRAALRGSGWPLIAMCLLAGLALHVCELAMRWAAFRIR